MNPAARSASPPSEPVPHGPTPKIAPTNTREATPSPMRPAAIRSHRSRRTVRLVETGAGAGTGPAAPEALRRSRMGASQLAGLRLPDVRRGEHGLEFSIRLLLEAVLH